MTAHGPDRLLRQAAANAEQAWKATASAGEMLAAAAWTIFLRTHAMAGWAVRGRVDERELRLMVVEKLHAAIDCSRHAAASMGEMQAHLAQAWLEQVLAAADLTRAALAGAPGPAGRHGYRHGYALGAAAVATPLALAGIATRGYARALTPYHRRTSANVKRLARRKRWR